MLSGKLSPRGLAVIDIIGTLFSCCRWSSWSSGLSVPLVAESYKINEILGQRRWPDPLAGKNPAAHRLYAAHPAGRVSELIKRVAFLMG